MSPEAKVLAEAHGGIWGEHPKCSVSFWQEAVRNDDTRSSYWDFVVGILEQEEHESGG